MTGTVKRIKDSFFFITDEDGRDRFAHENDLVNVQLHVLNEGDRVEFDPVDAAAGGARRNGLRAMSVRRIS